MQGGITYLIKLIYKPMLPFPKNSLTVFIGKVLQLVMDSFMEEACYSCLHLGPYSLMVLLHWLPQATLNGERKTKVTLSLY